MHAAGIAALVVACAHSTSARAGDATLGYTFMRCKVLMNSLAEGYEKNGDLERARKWTAASRIFEKAAVSATSREHVETEETNVRDTMNSDNRSRDELIAEIKSCGDLPQRHSQYFR